MLRSACRPSCFGKGGPSILPGTADMAGFVVVPEVDDFPRITPEDLQGIYEDVTLSRADEEHLLWRLVRTQPRIEVKVLSAPQIRFEIISDGAGPQTVSYREGRIDYNGALYDELVFEAATISTLFAEPSFLLYGKDGPLRYAGTLKFVVAGGKVQAVNPLGAEDYLLSVISQLPAARQRSAAVRLRAWLYDKLEGYPVAYPGLTEQADAAARAVIDETWGKLE